MKKQLCWFGWGEGSLTRPWQTQCRFKVKEIELIGLGEQLHLNQSQGKDGSTDASLEGFTFNS